jgi:magnesium transporter
LSTPSTAAGACAARRRRWEDAVHPAAARKARPLPDHPFLSTYAVRFDPTTGELAMSEIAHSSPPALVTVRKDEWFDIDAVVRRWDPHTDLAKYGVAFLVHGLLDYVVDGHFRHRPAR